MLRVNLVGMAVESQETDRSIMNAYESQFRAIVGEQHNPLRDVLPVPKAEALAALIDDMPVSQQGFGGSLNIFEGWCDVQSTYLAVTIEVESGQGYRARCASENWLDSKKSFADEDSWMRLAIL